MTLTDDDLLRYSRQLILPGFELEHQERLKTATVLVVGCGGLGSPLALYLAAAGVGRLLLADGDVVDRSNLHRQILYGAADAGQAKVARAAALLRARYPCEVVEVPGTLEGDALEQRVRAADIVADATDNFPTRYALNRACLSADTALVTAAAVRMEGQLATFHAQPDGPCYRCLYPREGDVTALSCRDSGVLGPVVGTLGSLQALEVIRVLTGWGKTLQGRLLRVDLALHEQSLLTVARRRDCPDCAVVPGERG